MTATATPLPWRFDELGEGRSGSASDGCGYIRCETDNLEISHHGDMGRSRSENLANAVLIVRAVNAHADMLAVVRELIGAIADKSIQRNPAYSSDDAKWLDKRARAALSKAEGRT